MADVGYTNAGEAAIEHFAPEPPAQPVAAEPAGVLLGAGGDPLMLGLPIFIVGSMALAFALVGVVPAAGLGTIIPIIAAASAVGLFVSTGWAVNLGQSIVACIFGLFSGFWASLAMFLLGVFHGWFVIPATAVVHAQELFFISWDILFVFLFVITLRLPMVYPAIIAFIIAAVTLVVLGLEYPGSVSSLDHIAGICTFVFAGLGFVAWLNAGSVAMGGPPTPPLGPPVIR